MAIAFRSEAHATGAAGSITISVPAGVVDGDVLIAEVNWSDIATAHSAWTTIIKAAVRPTVEEFYWAYRIAHSEPANYTFAGGSGQSAGVIRAYTGVDIRNVLDVAGLEGTVVTSGTTLTAPTRTTVTNGAMLLCAFVSHTTGATTTSTPTGMTERADLNSSVMSLSSDDEIIASAGATGTRVATHGATVSWGTGFSCALRPLAAGLAQAYFPYTGGNQDWTVPASVTSVDEVLLAGAGSLTQPGGLAKGTLAVTPAESIRVVVGGKASGGTGGFNGGATGNVGGAGATDARQGGTAVGNRVAVAGGAGGAGKDGSGADVTGAGGAGGQGGAATGQNGTGGGSTSFGSGGSGGTGGGSGGASGGAGSGSGGGSGGSGGGGKDGGSGGGAGGTGADGDGVTYAGGGGGGGGGSNYVGGLTSTTSTRGAGAAANFDGWAIFTWTNPPPTSTAAGTLPSLTGAASGAETFAATAAGTLPSLTGAATDAENFPATGAGTLPSLTAAASGAENFPATAAGTLPSLTAAAAGLVAPPATSTAAGTLPSLRAAASGDVEHIGEVTITEALHGTVTVSDELHGAVTLTDGPHGSVTVEDSRL